jgi:hypothetical protein
MSGLRTFNNPLFLQQNYFSTHKEISMSLKLIGAPSTQSTNLPFYIDPDVDDEKQGLDFVSPSKQPNVEKPDEPQQESTKTNTILGKALLKLETAWDKYVDQVNSADTDSSDSTLSVEPFDDVQKTYIQTKAICEKLIEAIENSRNHAVLSWTTACLDPNQMENKADTKYRLNTLDNINETINFIEDAAEKLIDSKISPSDRFHATNSSYYQNLHDTLLSTGEALSSLLRRIEDCNLALNALGSSKIAQISSSQAEDVDKLLGFKFSDKFNLSTMRKFRSEMAWTDPLFLKTFPKSAGKAIKYYCSLLISVREFLDKYKYQLGNLNPSQALIYFQTYQFTFEIEEKLTETTKRIAEKGLSAEDMDSSDIANAYNLTIKHMVANVAEQLPEPTIKWNTEKEFADFLTKEARINKWLHNKIGTVPLDSAVMRFLLQVLVYADLQINNLRTVDHEYKSLIKQMYSDLGEFDIRAEVNVGRNQTEIFYEGVILPNDIRQVINLGLRANAAREDILHKKQKEQQNNVALQQSDCLPINCVIL